VKNTGCEDQYENIKKYIILPVFCVGVKLGPSH